MTENGLKLANKFSVEARTIFDRVGGITQALAQSVLMVTHVWCQDRICEVREREGRRGGRWVKGKGGEEGGGGKGRVERREVGEREGRRGGRWGKRRDERREVGEREGVRGGRWGKGKGGEEGGGEREGVRGGRWGKGKGGEEGGGGNGRERGGRWVKGKGGEAGGGEREGKKEDNELCNSSPPHPLPHT